MDIRPSFYFFFLTAFVPVKAQDELPEQVTVAHRMEAELSEMGGSLSIFGRDEIDLMGGLFVADILRWSPGVSLTRTGGPGQNTKMYVRGTEPRHTLLLIDGMEIRNTNSPDGFDIVNLPTGDIERIELIRGPYSPLYGADALGGVLNIVTRDAGGKSGGSSEVSMGSYGTLSGALHAYGREQKLHYSVHGSLFNTDGFSVVEEGSELDPYENQSVSLLMGYDLSKSLALKFNARLIEAEIHYDNAASSDEIGYISETQDMAFMLAMTRQIDLGAPLDRFAISHKEFQQDTMDFGFSHYFSQARKAEWQRTINFGEQTRLMVGLDYLEEEGLQQTAWSQILEKLRSTSGFVQVRKSYGESFAIDLGTRLDDSDNWGSEATWRAAASYRLSSSTRLKGSISTGFSPPNVYYLANAQDPKTLQPEESNSYDFGIEHTLFNGNAFLGLTYFHNDIDDLMGWNAAYKVINIDRAKARGVETSLNWQPVDDWRIMLDWTHLLTEDLATRKQLDFRPENQLGVRIFWQPSDLNLSAFLGVRHRSVLYNVFTDSAWNTFNNEEVNPSPGGTSWEAALQYKLSANAHLFLRGEDLFNQQIEEMRDYNGNPYAVSGRAFRLGLKWRF